jgi:YVTN family beta-propeller protein
LGERRQVGKRHDAASVALSRRAVAASDGIGSSEGRVTGRGDESPNSSGSPNTADQERLESWKEIAGYLNKDVRTVQRWERTEHLPIRRHAHPERGSVYAYRSEIDAWHAARQVANGNARGNQNGRRSFVVVVSAASIVALLVVGLVLWRQQPRRPRQARPADSRLQSDAPRLLDDLTREAATTTRIRVGRGNHAMVLTPDGRELYVANSSRGGVSIVDTARQVVTRQVEAMLPYSLAIDPDGARVYVGQASGDILVIDTRTKAVRQLPTRTRVRDLALSGDGKTLYVAAEYSGLVAVTVATGEARVLSALPCPMHLAMSPERRRMFVNYQCRGPSGRGGGHDTIDVIDTETESSVGIITGLANVGGNLAVTPDGSQVWVDGSNACTAPEYDHVGCPQGRSGVVNVVRTSDLSLLRPLPLMPGYELSSHVSFTPEGSRAILGTDTTEIVNTGTLAPVEAAPLALHGRFVFSGDGATAFAPVGPDDTISVISIKTRPLPPGGLAGRWTGDGTANDAVGLAHGVMEGGVRFEAGHIGNAFSFDGSQDAVRVDGPSNLGIVDRAFSLLAWVKFDGRASSATSATSAEMTLADRQVSSANGARGWRLVRRADGRLTARFGGAPRPVGAEGDRSVVGRSALDFDRWYLVGLVWTGSEATLYVDGYTDGTARLPGFVDDNAEPLRFGDNRSRTAPLRGLLDEIEVYERALDVPEMASRYSALR